MQNLINLQNLEYSYLGKGSIFEGTFKLFGTTHLGSKVEGSIIMKDLADITIETSGSLIGDIKCHNLEVFGKIKGSINSTGNVVIHPSAHIQGEIKASNLVIHPGALVEIEAHTIES